MKKTVSIFCLTYILAFPNLYAQSGNSGPSDTYKTKNDKVTTNKTTTSTRVRSGSSTDSMSSDVIGTSQSSTKRTNCITVEAGTFCGPKATSWCSNHMSEMECRKLHNDLNLKSEKEKEASKNMPPSGY